MIKALITDFDGTLVDTFEANFRAYHEAFASVGLTLEAERYGECFGLRYEKFMQVMGIIDRETADVIREAKKEIYPHYFEYLRLNEALIALMAGFKALGGQDCHASTARKENLMNGVSFITQYPLS